MQGIGLIWLKMGIIRNPLCMRYWNSVFHKRWSENRSRGEYLDPRGMRLGRVGVHNEDLHCLCCSSNRVWVIKSIRLSYARHVDRMEGGRSAFKTLTGTPMGKRPLRRARHRWEGNIWIDLKESVNIRVDWYVSR